MLINGIIRVSLFHEIMRLRASVPRLADRAACSHTPPAGNSGSTEAALLRCGRAASRWPTGGTEDCSPDNPGTLSRRHALRGIRAIYWGVSADMIPAERIAAVKMETTVATNALLEPGATAPTAC